MQKHLYTVLFFSLMMAGAHAQISKGRVLLGGSLGFDNTSTNIPNNFVITKAHGVSIMPNVGIVTKENWVVGLDMDYVSSFQEYGSGNNQTYKTKSYGGSFYVRRYVPIKQRFYFFAEGAAGGSTTTSSSQISPKQKTTGWGAGVSLTPGVSYALRKKVLIESSLNSFAFIRYQRSKSSYYNEQNELTIGTQEYFAAGTSFGGNGLSLGFKFLL